MIAVAGYTTEVTLLIASFYTTDIISNYSYAISQPYLYDAIGVLSVLVCNVSFERVIASRQLLAV